MLIDEQIREIARKYAEEATKADAGDPNLSDSELTDIKETVSDYAVDVFRWLLRDYCVVEKSKVKTMYKELMDFAGQIVEMPSFSDRFNETVVKASLLKSLFGLQIEEGGVG